MLGWYEDVGSALGDGGGLEKISHRSSDGMKLKFGHR